MTELRFAPYTLPAADVGPENPLPSFRSAQHDACLDPAAHNIPPEDCDGLGCATGFRVLPCEGSPLCRRRFGRAMSAAAPRNPPAQANRAPR